MNLGETIAESKRRWERKPADYYSTPPGVTSALLTWMSRLDVRVLPAARDKPFVRVHEPCCGTGAISRVLERWEGFEVTSHDLHDRGYGEPGVDYLRTREKDRRFYDYDMVITNPPFSLAERFIRRALRDAPVVAMFLPNGYWHAKTRATLFRTRPPRAILALTWRPVFLPDERGSSPLANYSWTVWDDGFKGATQYHLLDKPCS